jgi:hypothetical protein
MLRYEQYTFYKVKLMASKQVASGYSWAVCKEACYLASRDKVTADSIQARPNYG